MQHDLDDSNKSNNLNISKMTETEPKPNFDQSKIKNFNNQTSQSIPSQNFNIPEEFKIDRNKLVLHEVVGHGG